MIFDGNRIAVDSAYFKGMNPQDQEEIIGNAVGQLKGINDYNRDLIEQQILYFISTGQDLALNGGAFVKPFHQMEEGQTYASNTAPKLAGIAVFDSDMISPDLLFGFGLGYDSLEQAHKRLDLDFNETELRMFKEFIIEHEGGHFFDGLLEAGSDLRAAAILMQRYPDSPELRNVLTAAADLRLVQTIALNGPLGNRVVNGYGLGSHEALMTMLTTSPEDLQALSYEEIVEKGRMFDGFNRFGGEYKGPMFTVRDALQDRLTENQRRFRDGDFMGPNVKDMDAIREEAQALKDSDVFDANSAEDAVLDSLIDSLDRMIERAGGNARQVGLDFQPVPILD